MNAPAVSVLMPVYNTPEEYLRPALESIGQQTFTDWELLVLDDASAPAARIPEIVGSYADSRIKYLPGGHLGVAATLNRGIRAAQGRFIARMDSDDIALPERFAKQVAYLETHPEIALLGTAVEFFPESKVERYPERVTFFALLYQDCLGHPAVMWRREEFVRHDLFYAPDCPAEDYELWTRAVHCVNIANLPEILLRYRVHPGQVCATRVTEMRAANAEIQRRMLAWLSANPAEQAEIAALCARFHGKPLTFWQRLFSVRNEGTYKVLRVLGCRLCFPKR